VQIATTPDGESLGYLVHGQAVARTPIVTVHGLVSSVHHWQFFTPHFAGERQVLSWEYRGHGGHPVPRNTRGVSVEQFAEDALEVWRASALSPSVVVGLSFGAQVALEIWRRGPAAVRALVLICGTAGRPLEHVTGFNQMRRATASLVRTLSRPALAGPILSFLKSRLGLRAAREITYLSGGAHRSACPPTVLEGLFGHVASLDPHLNGTITAGDLQPAASAVLPTRTEPTLIISGDKDLITPVATAEKMQQRVRGSELVVFPGHSHLVQVEKPREVHDAITDFLNRHGL
jgi:pimeloyl-ACP methyl ester carboxylesterase